ncbi:MAG: hypothetical protein ABSH34_31320 [Verrucomicrobiota bacterium]
MKTYGHLLGKLARWLSLHYASAAVRAFAAEDPDPDAHWLATPSPIPLEEPACVRVGVFSL